MSILLPGILFHYTGKKKKENKVLQAGRQTGSYRLCVEAVGGDAVVSGLFWRLYQVSFGGYIRSPLAVISGLFWRLEWMRMYQVSFGGQSISSAV